jgi:hypothetical protein
LTIWGTGTRVTERRRHRRPLRCFRSIVLVEAPPDALHPRSRSRYPSARHQEETGGPTPDPGRFRQWQHSQICRFCPLHTRATWLTATNETIVSASRADYTGASGACHAVLACPGRPAFVRTPRTTLRRSRCGQCARAVFVEGHHQVRPPPPFCRIGSVRWRKPRTASPSAPRLLNISAFEQYGSRPPF